MPFLGESVSGVPRNLVPVLLMAYVAWRMYRRFRRNVGPQLFRRRRLKIRVGIYAAIVLFLVFYAFAGHLPQTVTAGLFAGLALGVPVGFFGLRLTRFETRPEGRCYVPNTVLGVSLSLLLAARLVYRLLVFSQVGVQTGSHPQFMRSPLTLFIFGLVAGYYMTYFIGLLTRNTDWGLPARPDKV